MENKRRTNVRHKELTFVEQVKALLIRFGGVVGGERISIRTIKESELIERLSSFIKSFDSSISIVREHALSNSALQPDLVLKKDNRTAIIDLISSLTAEAIPGRLSHVLALMVEGGFDEGILYVIQNPSGAVREAMAMNSVNGKEITVHYLGLIENLKQPTTFEPSVGRNETCHCGSGKKYKKCCLPNKTNHQTASINSGTQRVLLQGPSLIDLTDLLYYDALVYESTNTENLPSDAIDKLADANLVYPLNALKVNSIDWNTVTQYVISHSYRMNQITTKDSAASFSFGRNVWIQLWAEAISQFLKPLGLQATPKYCVSSEFFSQYSNGSDEVLSIIYSSLPRLEVEKLDIDYFLDFLKDDETQKLRRRLFCWQNEIETSIEKQEVKLEHVADLLITRLDDYSSWLQKSELKLKYEKCEIIYYFLASIIVPVSLPKAIEKIFQFKKRKIELLDDEKVLGRELAYIAHAQRRFVSK